VVDQLAERDAPVVLALHVVEDALPSFVAQYLEDVGLRERRLLAEQRERLR
jgi:hypothetical protein